jgi:hypothetical protein
MDPSEFETLGYIALKKRMKEFVAADADLLKVVEEEMQPGKSAGGKVRVGIELVRIELIFVTWHVFGCTPALMSPCNTRSASHTLSAPSG